MSETMLYKPNGPHKIHGGSFDYVIVADHEIDAKLAEGWFLTTTEAAIDGEQRRQEAEYDAKQAADAQALAAARALIAKHEGDDAPPTREELQQRLRQLGIPFHHKAGAAALAALLPKDGQ
jgi:hypothetical protein